MFYILESLLCVFLIVCFNEETKIEGNIKCPDHCNCLNGGNPGSISIVCNNFSDSLSQDLKNISHNNNLSVLAFGEINADSFPKDLFFEISFESLILSASNIKRISSDTSNPFRKVKDEEQTQVLTFISSDVSEWKWSTDFDKFTNIKVIHVEDCTLPEVSNFRNWSRNSLISLSLINSGIVSIHEQEFSDWPYLRMVSLSHNSIKLLDRNWFAPNLTDLWSLDLSYNKIIRIDENFFDGMTALRRLRLDNNQLLSLPFESIEHVWNIGLLSEFSINNNQIECGRRDDLCWIALEPKFPYFFDMGECVISNTTNVRYFYSLKGNQVCPDRSQLTMA